MYLNVINILHKNIFIIHKNICSHIDILFVQMESCKDIMISY